MRNQGTAGQILSSRYRATLYRICSVILVGGDWIKHRKKVLWQQGFRADRKLQSLCHLCLGFCTCFSCFFPQRVVNLSSWPLTSTHRHANTHRRTCFAVQCCATYRLLCLILWSNWDTQMSDGLQRQSHDPHETIRRQMKASERKKNNIHGLN